MEKRSLEIGPGERGPKGKSDSADVPPLLSGDHFSSLVFSPDVSTIVLVKTSSSGMTEFERRILQFGGILFLLFLLSKILFLIKPFILAFLIGLAFHPALSWLEKRGIRRGVSLFLGIFIFLALLGLAIYFFVPPFVHQLTEIFSDLPRLWEQLARRWGAVHDRYPRLIPELQAEKLIQQLAKNIERFYPLARQFASGLFSLLATSILVFFILIFGLYNPTQLKGCLLEAIPPCHREKASRIGRRILAQLRSWIQGLLLAMLFVGVLSYLGLLILKVKYALAFGVLSGSLEIVPYLGPVLSAPLPTIFTAMEDPARAVYVLVLFFLIQHVENHVLIPLVMSRQLTLHPLGVIFFFLVMTYLLGFFGTFVAVPTYACAAILYEELYLQNIRAEEERVCKGTG